MSLPRHPLYDLHARMRQHISADLYLPVQVVKVQEEAGEIAEAWIGHMGVNPRKGRTHSLADVRKEALDVATTALMVHLAAGGLDSFGDLDAHIAERLARLDEVIA